MLYSKATAQKFFPEQCGHEIENVSFEVDESGDRCPGTLAIALILFPIILILIGTIAGALIDKTSTVGAICTFIGDKNVALFIGVVAALFMLRPYFKRPS